MYSTLQWLVLAIALAAALLHGAKNGIQIDPNGLAVENDNRIQIDPNG